MKCKTNKISVSQASIFQRVLKAQLYPKRSATNTTVWWGHRSRGQYHLVTSSNLSLPFLCLIIPTRRPNLTYSTMSKVRDLPTVGNPGNLFQRRNSRRCNRRKVTRSNRMTTWHQSKKCYLHNSTSHFRWRSFQTKSIVLKNKYQKRKFYWSTTRHTSLRKH